MRGRPTPRPPDMNEPILTVAAEKTEPTPAEHSLHLNLRHGPYLTDERKKLSPHFSEEQNFSALFDMHGRASLSLRRTGQFSIGEYLRCIRLQGRAWHTSYSFYRRTLIL